MDNMPRQLHLLERVDEVGAFLSFMAKPRRLLGLDTETTGLSLARDRLRLVQFGDEDEAWAIPYEEWRGVIRHALEVYDGPLVLQNAKFDAGFLRRAGLPFPWERAHDTRVMLFLYDSLGPQSLKPAAGLHLGPWARMGQTELKKAMAKNRWTWETVPVDFGPYWGYACIDTIITVRLALKLWPLIQPYRAAYDLEMACQRVVNDIELRGVRLDVPYVQQLSGRMRDRLNILLDDMPCNPDAPADVARALQEEGVALTARAPQGGFSVTEEVLSGLASPLAAKVLAYRRDKKVVSTWLDGMLKAESVGRLHPDIKSLEAKTGRMSIINPPMQTLPKTALVRDAIIPEDGHKLVLVDYDNQELRVAAHFADDHTMISAFAEGRDLHMEVAQYIYGESAGKAERTKAKIARFSTLYGAQAAKLSESLGIPLAEAERIVAGLAQANPGLTELMARVSQAILDRAEADGRKSGWVQLIDGRHLRVDVDKPYAGLNYLIQGSCATVLKQAMVNLDAVGLGEALRLPVHDELVFSIPTDEVEDALPVIQECMERHDLRVPLTVSPKVVDRWGDPYREAS